MSPTLGHIVRTHRQAYVERFRPPPLHLKVLSAVANCRTAALGGHASVCTSCGTVKVWYNSCGNRHCPQCQAFEKEKWVEKRKAELLPVQYLHLVFTLPHELNPLVLSNDRLLYNLLFRAVWQTMRQLGQDQKWLGAQPGMIAVLHTWGSNLSLHPHLHCIVPAGGITAKGRWKPTRKKNFFVPVKKVLSPVFRGKFMALLTGAFENNQLQFFGQAKPLGEITELRRLFRKLHRKNWVVYAKRPFGGPEQIINYLSRYTHRIAISNRRIAALEDGKVSFYYKNYRKKDSNGLPVVQTLTLDVMEFLRRFLMHVLPRGFQRIRYYGFLATRNRRTKLKSLQQHLGFTPPAGLHIPWQQRLEQLTGLDPEACPYCQSKTLQFIGYVPRQPSAGRSPPAPILVHIPPQTEPPVMVLP